MQCARGEQTAGRRRPWRERGLFKTSYDAHAATLAIAFQDGGVAPQIAR
jgi:hypothetical protein